MSDDVIDLSKARRDREAARTGNMVARHCWPATDGPAVSLVLSVGGHVRVFVGNAPDAEGWTMDPDALDGWALELIRYAAQARAEARARGKP